MLQAVVFNQLLQLPELLHNGVNVIILPNIVDSCNHDNFQPIAVLEHILHQGSGEVSHPGPHNALYLDVLGFFGQRLFIPDAIKGAVTKDDPPGGVARLNGGL